MAYAGCDVRSLTRRNRRPRQNLAEGLASNLKTPSISQPITVAAFVMLLDNLITHRLEPDGQIILIHLARVSNGMDHLIFGLLGTWKHLVDPSTSPAHNPHRHSNIRLRWQLVAFQKRFRLLELPLPEIRLFRARKGRFPTFTP
jgi:hypothetical protein